MSKSCPSSVEACITGWADHYRSHNMPPETIASYVQTVNIVLKNLREGKREELPFKWLPEDAYWLINFWNQKGLAVTTQRGYLFAMNSLAKFHDNFLIDRERIRWPADVRPNVDWLTLDEAKKIQSCWKDKKQSLAIHLMLNLALRRIEVIRLSVADIHTDSQIPYIDVDGKSHKRRSIPFSRDTKRILDDWLRVRCDLVDEARAVSRKTHRKFVDDGSLIVYRRGSRISGYSESGFDKAVILEVNRSSGLYFSNHTLRRTWGRVTYYEGGADILDISHIYGHSSITQTMKYIGVKADEMQKAILKTPL